LWRESDNDNRKGIGKGDYVAYFEGWERRERGNEGQEIGDRGVRREKPALPIKIVSAPLRIRDLKTHQI